MERKINFAPELQLRGHQRIFMDHGSREKLEYQPVFDKKGVWHLEESGKTNTYLEIQSHADSCDINILMARFAAGERDVLTQIQNSYGDVSEIPTNYAEIMNQRIKAETTFMGLSADVRAKFNNSVEQFMAQIGTREGLEALGVKFNDGSDLNGSVEPPVPATKEGE